MLAAFKNYLYNEGTDIGSIEVAIMKNITEAVLISTYILKKQGKTQNSILPRGLKAMMFNDYFIIGFQC